MSRVSGPEMVMGTGSTAPLPLPLCASLLPHLPHLRIPDSSPDEQDFVSPLLLSSSLRILPLAYFFFSCCCAAAAAAVAFLFACPQLLLFIIPAASSSSSRPSAAAAATSCCLFVPPEIGPGPVSPFNTVAKSRTPLLLPSPSATALVAGIAALAGSGRP